MADAQKRARSKPRRRPVEDRARFLFQIIDWNADYSFGFAGKRTKWDRSTSLFNEYRHLGIQAAALSPKSIAGAPARVALVPAGLDLHEATRVDSLGSVDQSRDGDINALVIMPADAGPYLLQGLGARAYRFVEIEGTRWLRRHSEIRRFAFTRRVMRSTYGDVEGEIPGVEDEEA